MVDFLKLQVYDLILIDYFNNNELLTWLSDTDKATRLDNEVITTKKIKQFKGIYFCFYSNRLDILFKPHYLFNDNLHNANDFKINDCISRVLWFKNTFKIDMTKLKVVNIEFGLNVISPINIKDLITFLAYHEKNQFRTDVGLPFSKKSYSIKRNGTANKYKFCKAYAKGLQFIIYCHIDTFRFEISSKENKYCRKELNISTANDLLNVEVYYKMTEVLMKEFREVLILDCVTNFDILNTREQKKLKEYLNPLTWYKIENQSRNSFSKNKIKYYNLVNKVDNNLKSKLEKIIFDKLEILKEGAISTTPQKVKEGAISTIYINGICTQNKTETTKIKKTVCKITGLNISMQKDNSIMLSHTGLNYYHKTDKNIFEQIKRRYLSNRWSSSDFETQIKEIAHSIRNAKSNQGIKQNRIYPIQQVNFLNKFEM